MPDEVYVSGGGALNPTLMRHLAELLAPIPVATSAALGVDPEAKEAIAFAVLANQTLFGHARQRPRRHRRRRAARARQDLVLTWPRAASATPSAASARAT